MLKGAVPICLDLGEPSAEILWRCKFVLIPMNPAGIVRRASCGPVRIYSLEPDEPTLCGLCVLKFAVAPCEYVSK